MKNTFDNNGGKAPEILSDLIKFRTDGNAAEINACFDYIEKYIKDSCGRCIIKRTSASGGNNLTAVLNADSTQNIKGGLMLCGHIDVVSGEDAQFSPYIKDGRLHGRGAADMKGAVACFLDLLPELKDFPVILALTSDEETEVKGILDICGFILDNRPEPAAVILGEPTDNMLCVQSCGILGYKTVLKGIAAHSSRQEQGVNAVCMAASVVKELERIAKIAAQKGVYLNPGRINGGDNLGVVPDTACVEWGFRYTELAAAAEIFDLFEESAGEIEKQYKGGGISTSQTCSFPAYSAQNRRECDALSSKLGVPEISIPYTTEAGYLTAAGQNVYLIGPGKTAQSHTASEYVSLADLETYENLLRTLCRGL